MLSNLYASTHMCVTRIPKEDDVMPVSLGASIDFPDRGDTHRYYYPSPLRVGPWLLPVFWAVVLLLALLLWCLS
jgi:hypothetical protein